MALGHPLVTPPFEREVLDRLTRIEGHLSGFREMLEDIEYDLDGNGQPGIKHRLSVLETRVDERTSRKQTYGVPGMVALVVMGALKAVEQWAKDA
jgi:hypothetical protein